MTSLDAVSLYENRSLDFIFIDASHEYEDVKKDIIAWYPKLKLGGIIAGHDYTSYDGVKKAVDEILINKNLNIRLENSYWIHKKN
jgi:predicted O-methyltransferase YrrM